MKNLDDILNAAPENTAIKLTDNAYTCSGWLINKGTGPFLKKGVSISADNPVVIYMNNNIPDDVTCLYGLGNNQVTNVRIILEQPSTPGFKRNGIYLEPNGNNLIKNCVVANPIGVFVKGKESFPFFAGQTCGDTVLNCIVTNPLGDYISAFVGYNVEGCTCNYPIPSNDPGAPYRFHVGINIGACSDPANTGIVSGNTITNASAAVYADWHTVDGVAIHGNVFENCDVGLCLIAQVDSSIGFVRCFNRINFFDNILILNPNRNNKELFRIDHTHPDYKDRTEVTVGFVNEVNIYNNELALMPGVVPTDFSYFMMNIASLVPKAKINPGVLGISNVHISDNITPPNTKLRWRVMGGNALAISTPIVSNPIYETI